jgi:hypothetical protein
MAVNTLRKRTEEQATELPMRIFTLARTKRTEDEKRGLRPNSPRSAYGQYVKGAAAALGINGKEFDDLFKTMEERYSREMKAQERDEAIEDFRSVIGKYEVPKGLATILKKKGELVAALSSEEDPIDLIIVVKDDLTLDVEARRPRRTRATDGEVSETSRISSWDAYERGQKAGDTFKVTKIRPRVYRDEATGDTFENLTGWLREHHPESHAAEVLRRYNQL